MEANCIICIYDDHYEVVGPFPDRASLVAFGEKWQEDNGDRPTWQSIYLANPYELPRIITPE
jgi:hypothetical protein